MIAFVFAEEGSHGMGPEGKSKLTIFGFIFILKLTSDI
jgi:hypothetical protein